MWLPVLARSAKTGRGVFDFISGPGSVGLYLFSANLYGDVAMRIVCDGRFAELQGSFE